MATRACVFCRKTGKQSREHIWPRWLQRHFGLAKTEKTGVHLSTIGQALDVRVGSFDKAVLRRVCADCNSGWMSTLEGRAKKILVRHLDRAAPAAGVISGEESLDLANWAFKTAILINTGANYRQLVEDQHFHHLHDRQAPPPNTFIDLAVRSRMRGPLGSLQSQTWNGVLPAGEQTSFPALADRSYKIVLGVGPLMFRVCHWPSERYIVRSLAEAKTAALWPFSGTINVQSLDPLDDMMDFELVVQIESEQVPACGAVEVGDQSLSGRLRL